jgi:hypothetical protein
MKQLIILIVHICITCICQAQTSKSFVWVAWKDVPLKTKTALKQIRADKDGTAYDEIIELNEEKCDTEVAVLDLDGDGKLEYAIGNEGRYCCGTRGCSLRVYKEGGEKQIFLLDDWREVKPAKSGVISSTGVLIKFETKKW